MIEAVSSRSVNLTSSIGPMWPPQEASFNRVKGFYNNGIIRTPDEMSYVLSYVGEISRKIEERVIPQSRICVRAIVATELLYNPDLQLEPFAEAVIPLSGTQDAFEDTVVLYLGSNRSDRIPHSTDLTEAFVNQEQALKRGPHPAKAIIERVVAQGYGIHIAKRDEWADEHKVDQLFGLYKRFGWKREDILDLLTSPSNILTLALYQGEIVAAGIAESSRIILGRNNSHAEINFRLTELTEAATLEEHQGRGLYSAIATRALMELHSLSNQNGILGGPVDIVYGESNGLSLGVLKAARTQGRRFSSEAIRDLNLSFLGYLPQHVPVDGAPRRAVYNDFFPTFISKKGIEEFMEA